MGNIVVTKKTFILLMAVVALIVFVGAKLNSKNNPNPQATENNSSLGIWVGRYPQLATIASTPIKPSLKTAPPDKTKAELMGETFPQTESQSTFYLHTPALPLRKTDSYYLVPVNITGTYTILTDKTFKDNLAESILYSDVAQNDLGYENPGVCNGKMYPMKPLHRKNCYVV